MDRFTGFFFLSLRSHRTESPNRCPILWQAIEGVKAERCSWVNRMSSLAGSYRRTNLKAASERSVLEAENAVTLAVPTQL
jgi:hypothetical protein